MAPGHPIGASSRLLAWGSRGEQRSTWHTILLARSRAAEIEKLLDKYIPGVEAMETKLRKYDTEYKTLTAENAELEGKLRTAEDAGKERIANRLKYAGMEKELQ